MARTAVKNDAKKYYLRSIPQLVKSATQILIYFALGNQYFEFSTDIRQQGLVAPEMNMNLMKSKTFLIP